MPATRHPWHPIFVHFPIACWIIAFATDALYRLLPELVLPGGVAPGAFAILLLWTGNVTALVAMVTGLVDMTRLPEDQNVMPTVYKHMAWMTSAFALMLGVGLLRTSGQAWTEPPGWPSLAMGLAAVICLIFGGLRASHLVYHLHLGKKDWP